MSALSIVENSSFVDIFRGMNLQVLTRKTCIKKNNDKCTIILDSIKNQLANAAYVCTTADVWSTTKRSFFGLTSHWIDKDYNRCSAALACKRFTGSHTYDRVAEMLQEIHNKFNLTNEKLVATVTDNGSNFVKAFHEFGC